MNNETSYEVKILVTVNVTMSGEAKEAFHAEQARCFDDLDALDAGREAVTNGLDSPRRLRHRWANYTGLKILGVDGIESKED